MKKKKKKLRHLKLSRTRQPINKIDLSDSKYINLDIINQFRYANIYQGSH